MKRTVSGITLTLLLISMLVLAFDIQPIKGQPTTWVVDDDGPADFHTIQEAVNAAIDGDTIFVKAGMYFMNLTITKSLTFIGEDRDEVTVTNAGDIELWGIFDIATVNCTVSGFTFLGNRSVYAIRGIRGAPVVTNCRFLRCFYGIEGGGNISHNLFVDNICGVRLSGGVVADNEFFGNGRGIGFLLFCFNAIIRDNVFYSNTEVIGIGMPSTFGENNSAFNNIFIFNEVGVDFEGFTSPEFSFYHNDFINNSVQAEGLLSALYSDLIWDDGYPSGGNYWSDYNGSDLYSGVSQNETGGDGIGDIAYVVEEDHLDYYPLMSPYLYVLCDVNRDGKVRVDDILTIVLAFGCTHGDPEYRPLMDTNGDGKIRVDDILTAVNQYGEGA